MAKKKLSYPRIANNEKIAVYVTEESGSPMIAVQELGTGMRALPASVDRELEYLEFGNNNYEVVYKYKDGETYSFNVDKSFSNINN